MHLELQIIKHPYHRLQNVGLHYLVLPFLWMLLGVGHPWWWVPEDIAGYHPETNEV